jgi:hypothetical protein
LHGCDHPADPDENPLTDREQWLLEVIREEFREHDEQINDLRRQVKQLRQSSNAEFASKIEQLLEGFCFKLDGTTLMN